jgi:hypothetical protein
MYNYTDTVAVSLRSLISSSALESDKGPALLVLRNVLADYRIVELLAAQPATSVCSPIADFFRRRSKMNRRVERELRLHQRTGTTIPETYRVMLLA